MCAVPPKMLVTKEVEDGGECQVIWTNGQMYDATVLACGKSSVYHVLLVHTHMFTVANTIQSKPCLAMLFLLLLLLYTVCILQEGKQI